MPRFPGLSLFALLNPARWFVGSSSILHHLWPNTGIRGVDDSCHGSDQDYGMNNCIIGCDSPELNPAAECYACHQPGVPAFHSTTCLSAHQLPEWEASAGSSLFPVQTSRGGKPTKRDREQPGLPLSFGPFLPILDPRSKRVKRWNRALLLARGMALAVDPLFFYVLSIAGRGFDRNGNGEGRLPPSPCLYMDGGLAMIVTAIRTCLDAMHLLHMWLQLRLAYVSKDSLVVGCGKLVWDPRAIVTRYVRSLKGLWFDLFVILPIPQAVVWFVIPKLVREEHMVKLIMPVLLVTIVFQFIPKVYHSYLMRQGMREPTGYIFGSIWWGFVSNLIAYFIASHVAGGCWYILAVHRVVSCLQKQCRVNPRCKSIASCSEPICYLLRFPVTGPRGQCGSEWPKGNIPRCLDENGPYNFGIYDQALPVISSNSLSVRILYPIFWGLLNLSTFANELAPSSELLEVIFSIIIILSGIMLFTLLVGNIQVFLHAVLVKKKKMQLRLQDVEWWMGRRQLPYQLRARVKRFECQRLAALGCEDEMELIKDLPDGLRRDIKRYLCLDLIKKVPLFHDLGDLILDHICDRVKPLLYSKDEKIIREGDPVHKMVFIMHGLVRRDQNLSKGTLATNVLVPGDFLGDELLSWSLRRGSSTDHLPASSATFKCLRTTEAFGLEAADLRYITGHFRYKFMDDKLKWTTRYFSSNWRTWAAVNIQIAWWRHRMKRLRTRGRANVVTHRPAEIDGGCESMLRKYAIMFMSLRPHDHLE